MSDESQGPGWWLASDGKWYPPDQSPGPAPSTPSYSPPGGQYGAAGGGGAAPGQSLDAGPALSYGWGKFSQNAGPLLAVMLIPLAVQFVLQFLGGRIIHGAFGYILFVVIAEVISLALSIGIINAALMVTRGEQVEIGKAFSSDRWAAWIGFAFVWGLMVGVGLLICLVGALFVIAIWGFAPFYFVDKNMSLGQALSASSHATGANTGLRVALALCALVGALGILVCGIGALVTMPIAYVGAAYLYRLANREPVAA